MHGLVASPGEASTLKARVHPWPSRWSLLCASCARTTVPPQGTADQRRLLRRRSPRAETCGEGHLHLPKSSNRLPRCAGACRQGSLASAAYGRIATSRPHLRGVLYQGVGACTPNREACAPTPANATALELYVYGVQVATTTCTPAMCAHACTSLAGVCACVHIAHTHVDGAQEAPHHVLGHYRYAGGPVWA